MCVYSKDYNRLSQETVCVYIAKIIIVYHKKVYIYIYTQRIFLRGALIALVNTCSIYIHTQRVFLTGALVALVNTRSIYLTYYIYIHTHT